MPTAHLGEQLEGGFEPHTDLGHLRRWSVPAEPESVAGIRRAVKGFCSERGVDERVAGDIAIAVSEALSNAVVHAYVGQTRGSVEVVVEIGDDEAVVRVTDSGRGMQAHPDSPGLGVGLPMIGRLARDVSIGEGGGGQGTEIRMTFAAPGARGRAADVAAESDRLEVLAHVADVTGGVGWPFAGYELLLSVLVPAVADACVIDVIDDAGGHHRLGARVADDPGGRLTGWLAGRTPEPDQLLATVAAHRDGRPRVLELDAETVAKLARDAGDRKQLERMRLTRWLNLPLYSGDQLMGSLGMGLRAGRPDPRENMGFLRAIAERVSRGMANARLIEELRRGGERFERILDGLGAAVTVNDRTGKVVYANEAAVKLVGAASVDEMLAAAPGELAARFLITHEDGSQVELDELPGRRLFAGEVAPALLTRSVERVTGREYWLLTRSTLLEADPPLAVNIIEDITESKTAELRQRFLAEAAELLFSPREYAETLELLADLAVPQLADWCAIDLLTDTGLERVGLSHGDPSKLEIARQVHERWPPEADPSSALGQTLHGGQAQLFAHITDEMLAETARDAEHLELVRQVGLRSAMIVPIPVGDRVLGVMTFANAESRRRFDEEDLRFAEELGRRAAVAIESARLATGALTSRDLEMLDAIFKFSPVGVGVWDRELRYLHVNPALARTNGLSVEEHLGRSLDEVLPDLDPAVTAGYRRVIETGEPWTDVEVGGATPAAPGERRYWRLNCFPVIQRDGRVEAIAAVISETTTERLVEEARRELEDRLADKRAVLEEVMERVPGVGIAVLWGPELRFRFVNRRWFEFFPVSGDPIGRPAEEALPEQGEMIASELRPVLETGESLVVEERPVSFHDAQEPVERYYRGTNTPIRRGGRVEGVLSVVVEVTQEAQRRRRLETELAAEQQLSETLQRALLPERTPRMPGLALAARYRPSGNEARVGGDFYDVFDAGGALFAAVGDITGKGPQAAWRAAFVRSAIRTLALEEASPGRVLDRAGIALAAHSGTRPELCTALCLRLEPDGAVSIAAAGHPPPLVFGAGRAEVVAAHGPILGLPEVGERAETAVQLEPGQGLLLYTDGLTDSMAPARAVSEGDLAALVAELWAGDPEALLTALLDRAVPPGVSARDDVALLAIIRSGRG